MDIENCNFSGLNDVRNEYCLDAKNKVAILKQLLRSSDFDQVRIQNTIKLLKEVKNKLARCDDSIHVLLEENALLQDIKESTSLSGDIDQAIEEAESLLDKFNDKNLELKFNGETVEWFRFWESFESEIHDREDLPPQFKLSYLKHRLESWPLHMITNLGTGESAYDEAINLLQTTFINKKALVESHLNALLDLKPPVATPISLMRYRSDFEYHIRALKAYKTNIEEPGILIAAVLNKKLPKEIWYRLNKADKRSVWTFPEFQDALNFEIELLNFDLAQNSSNPSDEIQDFSNSLMNNDSTKKTFVNGMTSAQAIMCQMCSGSHEVAQCTVYRTPSEKTKRAIKLNLCFTCFEVGHASENCEKPRCKFCNKKHNTLVCFSQKGNDSKKKLELKVKKSKKRTKSKVKKSFICQLCSGHHQITGCTVYKSEAEKMVRVKNLNLCLMCLNNEHITENCSKTSGCKFCGEFHNSLLCIKTKSKSNKNKKVKKKKIVCQLCSGHHQITGCIVYKSESEKMKRVKELNLCLLCINSDHITEKCLKKSGCRFCNEFHNSLLCMKSKSKSSKPKTKLKKKEKKACPLCSGPHENAGGCTVYKSAAAKMERVKNLNLCLVCVKNDHNTEKCCKKNAHCKLCRGKHNTMLCVSGNSKEIEVSKMVESDNSQSYPSNLTENQSTNYQKQSDVIQNGILKDAVRGKSNINNSSVTCILCSSNHEFGLCSKYKTSVAKRVRAVCLQLCLICLDNTHITDQCPKMEVCKFCSGRHHTFLCIESEEATVVVDEKLKSCKKKKKEKKGVQKGRKENRSTEIANPLISNFLLLSEI